MREVSAGRGVVCGTKGADGTALAVQSSHPAVCIKENLFKLLCAQQFKGGHYEKVF